MKSDLSENILFIAHHFPPMGGPGTNRSLKLAKHLKQFGYQPIVVTIALEDVKASSYPQDTGLLDEVKSLEIHRFSTLEPRKLKSILMKFRLFRLFWFLLYPLFWESSALWPISSYSSCGKIIIKNNIKLIYTTSGPFSSLILGYILKKKYNLKWVADIRDPFTDGYMWLWPSKLHWYFSRYFERKLLQAADKVVVNTPEVKRLYLKRGFLDKNKIIDITNGF